MPLLMRRMAHLDRLNGKADALVIKMNLENQDNEVAVSAAFCFNDVIFLSQAKDQNLHR